MNTQAVNNDQYSESTFYCQVDTYMATKDYLRKGRCVRLIGVAPQEFFNSSLAEGVTTFTIDIDYWEFCIHDLNLKSWRQITSEISEQINSRSDDEKRYATWYKLEVDFKSYGAGYLYRTFSEEPPKYFSIKSLHLVLKRNLKKSGLKQNSLNVLSLASEQINSNHPQLSSWQPNLPNTNFVFDTFHVGQGMCSLVHDEQVGFLLDVGAGKPITRSAYKANSIKNHLRSEIDKLQTVIAVISHSDSDHWRILAWDSVLRNKVSAVYFPNGPISLAMKDKAIKKKVFGLGDLTLTLSKNTTLKFLRSKPSSMDSNGNCLVTIFERDGSRVLASGDYVYERFGTDSNSVINNLSSLKYSAVVVPHHGDAASARNVVIPTDLAKAFFSAGTHQGYKHPTKTSLNEHKKIGFKNISKHKKTDIIRVNLI